MMWNHCSKEGLSHQERAVLEIFMLPNDLDVLKKLVGPCKDCKILRKAVKVLGAAINDFSMDLFA